MNTNKIQWKKLPSVVRQGKYFYRAIVGDLAVTVCQGWTSGKWTIQVSNGFVSPIQFDNQKQAMASIGNYIALT